MPPAFNLSQDQTLQFDLELLIQRIEVNFTSIFMSVCQSCDRTSFKIPVRNECHPKAATANTHAYRLYVFNDLFQTPPRSAKPSTISRFLDQSRTFFRQHACIPDPSKKRPHTTGALRAVMSLTMTYFHTGIRTIIGAESFHCPVRDGKEWDQLAMVIRL